MLFTLLSSILAIPAAVQQTLPPDSTERKYTRILSGSAGLAVAFALVSLPLYLKPYFSRAPLYVEGAYLLCLGLVFACQAVHRPRPARVLLAFGSVLYLTAAALLSVPEAFVRVYLFTLFPLAFFLFPRQERAFACATYAAAALAFVGLEASGYGGLGIVAPVPAEELRLARVSNAAGAALLLGAIAFLAARAYQTAELRLNLEKQRSEALLENILPRAVIDRLNAGEKYIAERHEETSVLFADLVGFTSLAAQRPPEEIVSLLSRIFTAFDQIAAALGVEKVKTIGDAYMAVAGAPLRQPEHAVQLARCALGLREYIQKEFGGTLQIRIGLHSGPVIAGILGEKKFAYDIWGDTVNTASRFESHGGPGRIHCSREFYERARDGFVFEERGEIEIKGKGRLLAYDLLHAATA